MDHFGFRTVWIVNKLEDPDDCDRTYHVNKQSAQLQAKCNQKEQGGSFAISSTTLIHDKKRNCLFSIDPMPIHVESVEDVEHRYNTLQQG